MPPSPRRKLAPIKSATRKPRFFEFVIKAIADLGESAGSTPKTISNQVQGVLIASRKYKVKKVSPYVERALRYALSAGIVSQKQGKFKLVQHGASLPNVYKFGTRRKTIRNKAVAEKRKGPKKARKRREIPKKEPKDSDTETSFASTVVPTKPKKPNKPKDDAGAQKPKKRMDFISCRRWF